MIFDATVDGRSVRVEVRRQDGLYTVVLDGQPLEVDFQDTQHGFVSLIVEEHSYEAGLDRRPDGFTVFLDEDVLTVELVDAARGAPAPVRHASGPARLTAPMPGKIVRLLAEPGGEVQAGQGLVVMEAMKMENELKAPRAGTLREVPVREGQTVEAGALLAVID